MNMLQIIEAIAIIPTLFLLIIVFLQYSILLFVPKKKISGKFKSSVSILVPAHNEGQNLEKTIESILNSGFKGKKEVIVIDDGSTDNTTQIIKKFEEKKLIRSVRTNHIGKSRAMNEGLKLAKYEIVVTVDGDTKIEKGSLDKLILPFKDEKVAATIGVIKVANTHKPLTWFQRLEYLYYSFYKSLCDRIDGIISATGTFSAIRKKYLNRGYSSKFYSEDIDLTLNLIKSGYKIRFAPEAIAYTFVPESLKGLAKQRYRWCRGCIQVMKEHSDLFFNRKHLGTGFFSLPVLLYWYWHSLVMGLLIFLQIFLGYYTYFYIYGSILSFEVIKYFFYWFSVFGMVNLSYQILIGNFPLTLLAVLNIIAVPLTYLMYFYSMRQLREKITVKDILALIFMFPYWILIMAVQVYSNREWLRPEPKNRWDK
jgi:cellulose synthase/poly-beta-1,6-N-acetylglucosamine synthase-like glycosyltransferase